MLDKAIQAIRRKFQGCQETFNHAEFEFKNGKKAHIIAYKEAGGPKEPDDYAMFVLVGKDYKPYFESPSIEKLAETMMSYAAS